MSLTYYGADNPLVETIEFHPTVVAESVAAAADGKPLVQEEAGVAKGGKRMVLEGVFQRADTQNANKRVYPRSLWERLLNEKSPVMKRVKERAMLGHLEHPEDGTTDLNKSAILVTGLKLKENGEVWGQCVVLNTPAGKIIQELVDAGVKFGISSRGTGSVDGKGVVQEDFNVDTWDIVYNPSTPGAYPTMENTSKPESVAEAAVAVAAPANDMPAMQTPPKGGEPQKPVLSVAAQIIAAGPEAVKSRTGLSDQDDVAKALTRVLSFANQHGELKTVDEVWSALLKLDPKYPSAKGANEAADAKPADKAEPAPAPAAPAVAEAVPPKADDKKDDAAPADKDGCKCDDGKPADQRTGDEKDEAAKAAPAAAPVAEAPKAEPAKAPVAEAASLLAEAKAAIAALEADKAKLSEANIKMTADLETSAAIVKELTEKVARLQGDMEVQAKALAEAHRLIAGLTSAKGAAQVAEAPKAQPAVADDKGEKPVGAVKESKQTTSEPAATPRANLAERIRTRERALDEKGLPAAGKLASSDDAGRVTESSADRAPLSKGARLAAAAIPKLVR